MRDRGARTALGLPTPRTGAARGIGAATS